MSKKPTFGTAMACPECGIRSTKVVDMRPTNFNQIRRRRVCSEGHRFTTYENADA